MSNLGALILSAVILCILVAPVVLVHQEVKRRGLLTPEQRASEDANDSQPGDWGG